MIDVLNPVDGSVVGQVEHHSESRVRAAIDRTCAAFPAWSRLLAKQRSDILRMMITRKSAIALAAGCTIIMKPVAETPQTAYENSISSDTPACSRLPDLPPTPAIDEVDYRGKSSYADWYRSFDRCHSA
jgi:delta 1-pyrroline-5-carboxylate dehydrogenase